MKPSLNDVNGKIRRDKKFGKTEKFNPGLKFVSYQSSLIVLLLKRGTDFQAGGDDQEIWIYAKFCQGQKLFFRTDF